MLFLVMLITLFPSPITYPHNRYFVTTRGAPLRPRHRAAWLMRAVNPGLEFRRFWRNSKPILSLRIMVNCLGYEGRKQYGPDEGPDIFVHQNDVRGASTLAAGDRVEFTVAEGPRGPKVSDVVHLVGLKTVLEPIARLFWTPED